MGHREGVPSDWGHCSSQTLLCLTPVSHLPLLLKRYLKEPIPFWLASSGGHFIISWGPGSRELIWQVQGWDQER